MLAKVIEARLEMKRKMIEGLQICLYIRAFAVTDKPRLLRVSQNYQQFDK